MQKVVSLMIQELKILLEKYTTLNESGNMWFIEK